MTSIYLVQSTRALWIMLSLFRGFLPHVDSHFQSLVLRSRLERSVRLVRLRHGESCVAGVVNGDFRVYDGCATYNASPALIRPTCRFPPGASAAGWMLRSPGPC